MANSRATGKYVLLDEHLATGTEATYTYTPGTALDMKNTYNEIQIIITGKATAALILALKLNAHTDYSTTNLRHDSTSLVGANATTQGYVALLHSVIIDGAVTFAGKINIWLNDASDELVGHSAFHAVHEGSDIIDFTDVTSVTTITAIEILVSTSTWIAGTKISIYGIRQ